jgi:CheY-like chemotaxis protein
VFGIPGVNSRASSGEFGSKNMSPVTPKSPKVAKARKPLIFLVDDQPMLLDLAEISLQGGDYALKKFLDPEEALDSFLNARVKPDLLITDYALGKMNGLELIERCKAAKPDLKTILVSGTAGAEIVLESPVKVDRFVGKPYQPTGLADLVQRVLTEAA